MGTWVPETCRGLLLRNKIIVHKLESKINQQNMIFIYPCIVNIIPNYKQQDAMILNSFISTDALHISDGSFARQREHKTV